VKAVGLFNDSVGEDEWCSPESKKPLSPWSESGRGMGLNGAFESVYEQGDQDDDRDWHTEEKQ